MWHRLGSKLSLRIDCKHLHNGCRVGFGFVTFDGSGPVDEIMNRRDHSIKGKEVSSPGCALNARPGRRGSVALIRLASGCGTCFLGSEAAALDACRVA